MISQFPVSGFYPLISHPHSRSPPGFTHCPCKYLLCMKLQPTCCCSCSYYALMLLYVCTIIYNLAWPDPILRRGTIACSISAYTASDNTSMWTRAWWYKTRSSMPSALPHGHFNPIASVLPSKFFNMFVWQFITWVPIVHLLTMHHVGTISNHWIHFYLKIR